MVKLKTKSKCVCGRTVWAKGKCRACYARWGRSLQHFSRGEERVVYFDFSCAACREHGMFSELRNMLDQKALVYVVLATFNDGSSHFIELKEIEREKVTA